MSVHTAQPPIDPTAWEHPRMRRALRVRDIGAVYHQLQHAGVSQRRIAALTGQSQSDVSEILSGRRVTSYDLLARIADGLGVPRGYLGMAYQADGEPAPLLDPATPLPATLSVEHAAQVSATTDLLRVVEADFGGGACRDAALAHLRRATRLLAANGPATAHHRLRLALADLHLLVGWASFDIGLAPVAAYHFGRTRLLAEQAGEPGLVAKAHYCLGRVSLHRGATGDATGQFRAGMAAARRAGCRLTVALLAANQAWATGVRGDATEAVRLLWYAEQEFIAANADGAPRWIRFFGAADLSGLVGMTHTALARQDQRRCAEAVRSLTGSLTLRAEGQARSRAFELTALATAYLLGGEREPGIQVGRRAVTLAEKLQSVRVIDRFTPLRAELHALPDPGPDAAELLARIERLQDRRALPATQGGATA